MKKINNELIKFELTNLTPEERIILMGTTACLYLITLFTVVNKGYSLSIGTFSVVPQAV